MTRFIQGILADWMKTEGTVQLSDNQITQAKNGINKMANIMDEIETVLADHGQAIATIEGFMEKHAKAAGAAVDPQRLQAVRDALQAHTARLAALMQKYPVVP